MEKYTLEKCRILLKDFDIPYIRSMEMIDSSHGDGDLRYNYILDKKYVLRVNSAQVFTEERFHELNALIGRYRAYGINAPLFLEDKNGAVLHRQDKGYFYVSEYLDGIIPPEKLSRAQERTLVYDRLRLIAGFSARYKNTELSPVMSMYSLFDLCPYDRIAGVDEKRQNLDSLLHALRECGREDTAARLERADGALRRQLLELYKGLPRCVYQGDENWQNLIVDEEYHITGLFDFNMAGTEVIANYLANNALLDPCCISDELEGLSAVQLYRRTLEDFRENTAVIRRYYELSEEEETAYDLYANITLMSGWPNVSSFLRALKKGEDTGKVVELLELIMDYPGNKEAYSG